MSPHSHADEPPSWQEFAVCTRDGRYCANVERVDPGSSDPWKAEYRLRVTLTDAGVQRELWSASYQYDGYPYGKLTDDGRRFIYVSHWYWEDRPVVRMVSEEGELTLDGSVFDVPSSALLPTVSHEVWLADGPRSYRILDRDTLEIAMRNGDTRRVDLRSGRLLR